MAEYMNKDRFLESMGLKGDETKYGNRDAEHQNRSYSTYMSYEIMDSVEDSVEEDVAPVVHGEWEVYLGGKELMCSACKATFWDEDGVGGSNYCPNCGAKMAGATHGH